MDALERLNLIQAIERDIRLKRASKFFKFGAVFSISFLVVYIISFILMFIPGMSFISGLGAVSMVSTIVSVASMLIGIMERNFIEKMPSYKEYCDNYTILIEGKEKIYKIKTLKGNTIYIDKNNTYEVSSKNFEVKSLNITEFKRLRNEIEEIKRKLSEQQIKTNNQVEPNDKKINMYILKSNSNTAIGREKELEKLQESLIIPNINPLIIGKAGVGKTALVGGLSYKIQKGEVCDLLKNLRIIEVNASELVSGCRYVGDFEERMNDFIEYAKNQKNTVFFFDEIHSLIGLGQGSKSNLDGANILKPYLTNGDIKIIGATTLNEYENIIKNDSAFSRRFEVIKLEEPTDKVLYQIVNRFVYNFEKKHNIKLGNNEIEKEAILKFLIELTDAEKKHRKFDCDINNPVLIINILTRAFAKAKINNSNVITKEFICKSLENNPNFYESALAKIIGKIGNISTEKNEEESFKQKIIKFPSK